MTRDKFSLLYVLKNNQVTNQRNLASLLGMALGKTNRLLNEARNDGLVDEGFSLTKAGLDALEPYRVDNAIIMAAGMSSRFAPLSYEKPKGLLVVRGEVLIERQIKQLKQAGINDITVVVGYMKEKFFYLQEKFDVKIVINDDYFRYNNPSTLIRVKDKLKNTYICSSDNYFVENVFESYVYDAYYAAIFQEGESDEWGLITDNHGRIVKIDHSPKDMWIMMGHVFFSKEFSDKFVSILEKSYVKESARCELWEHILEENLDLLSMSMRQYGSDVIREFDSLEELRVFDDKYIQNSGSEIFSNICRVLECTEKDITDISVVKQGLTNLSFKFTCNGKSYIYRHPGVGTEKYISRQSEAFSMGIAKKLGLDKTIIEIDGKDGWKISSFVENAHTLDYHNKDEVKQALALVKKLHDAAITSPYDFDIWQRTLDFIDLIIDHRKDFSDFNSLFNDMQKLYEYTKNDGVEKILCHCDCYDPNFLVDEKGMVTLIDWEYSGNDDPANDLGTFICCSDYTFDEAMEVFDVYYGRKPTEKELRHCLAYVAVASYYWFVWAIYQESIGNMVGDYLFLWYQNSKLYMNKAKEYYERNN
jgi:CTP:phosphocholine cytidylyltransferase-like protein/thiamine kinase-like enzyme